MFHPIHTPRSGIIPRFVRRPLPGAVLAISAVAAPAISLLAIAVLAAPAQSDLLLNEVFYDPAGEDEGQEFVELWNPDSIPLSLADVTLEGGDGAHPGTWVVIWRGVPGESARERGPYLIRGDPRLGSMQNGPDAIRLVRGEVILDLLGYGELLASGLFEGAPAGDAASGESLARVLDGVDTGVNRDDWAVESEPTPGLANHPDLRLRFSRVGATARPEVAWPGDGVELRVSIKNSGRLPVDGARWLLDAEIGTGAPGITWSRVGSRPGLPLAPAESVMLSLAIPAPPAGAYTARLVLRVVQDSSLADTVDVTLRSVAGPAVVNELSFKDAGAGEWIELWFREAIDDIGGLSVADATPGQRRIDRGATPRRVEGSQIFVVAQYPALVRARFGLPDSSVFGVSGTWPSLNDGGTPTEPSDRLRVLGADGAPCDAVPYHAEWSVRGGSLERLSADLPSAAAGTWAESIDSAKGTPGRPNSMRAPGLSSAAGGPLLIAGARVLRRRGGEAVPVVLRATVEARGRRLTVRVHDLLGRQLRTLVDGQRFSAEEAFLWDGRDDRGAPVPPGLYVIHAEALREEGAPSRASSLSLAVAAER